MRHLPPAAATVPGRASRRLPAAMVAALTALALLPGTGSARLSAQGAGSGASTVLRIAPAPRPLALGNALVAVTDPWALEYNPAGALAADWTVAAAYQGLPVGASAGAAAFSLPLGGARALGLSLRFVDYGEIEVIEPDPSLPVGHPTGETARGGEVTALAGGAVRLGPLRVGLAGRWLRVDVAGLVDDAFAADAGVTVALADWLHVAGSLQNLGGDLEAGRAAPLPRTVRAGAAMRRSLGPLDGLLTVEGRRREERTGLGAGLELAGGTDGIEAATRLGDESRAASGDAYSRLVFGGGIRLDRVTVDLAYRALGPLGSTRQVGIAYRF
jgi:hypothetical protein